jgi:hypothetical protein
MSESPALVALRKALAEVVAELPEEGKRKIAEAAITKILEAMETGVCAVGDWEKRCLAAAITAIRGGRFDQARTMARRALWPQENRTVASLAKFPLRPGMTNVAELKREFDAARAMRNSRSKAV